MNSNKGFTLIELLVVVLIIGILAAMAMPQYFKAVERSRMTEAVTLLGNLAQAQQRKWLQINRYAGSFAALDVAPSGVTGASFYTKGNATTGANGNGFRIDLDTANSATYNAASGTATRVNNAATSSLQYSYTLTRFYAGTNTTCTGNNANGAALCADFCGIDTLSSGQSCCNSGVTGACTAPANPS